MITNKTGLEYKQGDKVAQFICNPDDSLGFGFDAATAFQNFFAGRIQEISKKPEEEAKTCPSQEN